MMLGHLGWAGGEPVAYLGARPCAASYYEPDPLAGGAPLLVVQVEGLGEDRAALETQLGPLLPRGQITARCGDRELRRFRYWLRPARAATAP
jgi:hypothetical protein